ncbi:hypothetical protein [Streptomyces werraensis]|uniref:hypothetical protein n=1 Tax=Streptomyces werraensis TaxID=68284 RepID=UPI0037F85253
MKRAILAGLAGLVLGCALTTGLAPAPVDPVATFNDGFAEAKQDDCEQGSAAACEWVMIQNNIPLPPEGLK